jgi:hypothetical protein
MLKDFDPGSELASLSARRRVDMDDLTQRIIDWLATLPAGRTIQWYGDGLSRTQPWSALWEDVCSDEIQHEVACNWVWTIGFPRDQAWAGYGSAGTSISWAPDLLEFRVVEPDPSLWAPQTADGEVLRVTCTIGARPTPVEIARLRTALADGSGDRYVRGAGAWTQMSISRALNWWTTNLVGRDDLYFAWDPDGGPSPLRRELLCRLGIPTATR